ncbi:hypothetical protein HGM15179_011303 [Zosterops borbonicus]|uniref:Uncharacterized protein n=1 Tax=Zosterops borbonicus TaxID=364589 RepID=A0A8K1GDC4_9PASS|nr:hypothetical protein HGM15179_011303 [Zosterops borbonicus]
MSEDPIIHEKMPGMPTGHPQLHGSGKDSPEHNDQAGKIAKPLSKIWQQSWLTREIPVIWKSENVTLSMRRIGNMIQSTVSLTLVPWKAIEQIILSEITACQDHQGVMPSPSFQGH